MHDIGILPFKPFFNLTSNASNKETKRRKKHKQTLSNKMEEICVSGKPLNKHGYPLNRPTKKSRGPMERKLVQS